MTEPQLEVRTCAKCGLTDSHAHHVQYVAFNHPVTGEGVDLTVTKHVQCCAEEGCPICSVHVEQARLSLSDLGPSDAFTEFMKNPPREVFQALFERVGIESPEFQFPTMTEEA
jgi:hypothetical protein